MKSGLLYVLLALFVCGTTVAQERDSVLLQMNSVKLDPGLIYGYGVSDNVDSARCEAMLDLALRVAAFLEAQKSLFIHTLDQCPEGTVRFLDYSKDSVYARSVAYVSKQALKDFEQESAAEYDRQGLGTSITQLKDQMVRAMTMQELKQILFDTPAASLVKHGPVDYSTEDAYIVGGYIVYFDSKTGRIVEFRTPIGSEGIRCDARSGYPCEKDIPKGTKPYWIYIEEPNLR